MMSSSSNRKEGKSLSSHGQQFLNLFWNSTGKNFLNLSYKDVCRIVERDDLNVSSEIAVYEAVRLWIEEVPYRKIYAHDLIGQVRLPLIPYDYLAGEVSKDILLSTYAPEWVNAAMTYQRQTPKNRKLLFGGAKYIRRTQDEKFLYIFGQNMANSSSPNSEIQHYNFKSNEWTAVSGVVPYSRSGIIAYKGRVWFIGGIYKQAQREVNAHNNACSCDPMESEPSWQSEASLLEARCDHGVAVLEEEIYVVGGISRTLFHIDPLNSVEVLRRNEGRWEWQSCGGMFRKRRRPGVAVVGLKLYVAGGRSDRREQLDSVEFYTKSANTWTSIKSMGAKKSPCHLAVDEGLLYAVGGSGRSSYIRAYIMQRKQEWKRLKELPDEVKGNELSVAAYDDALFVISSRKYDGQDSTLHKFIPKDNKLLEIAKPKKIVGPIVQSLLYKPFARFPDRIPENIHPFGPLELRSNKDTYFHRVDDHRLQTAHAQPSLDHLRQTVKNQDVPVVLHERHYSSESCQNSFQMRTSAFSQQQHMLQNANVFQSQAGQPNMCTTIPRREQFRVITSSQYQDNTALPSIDTFRRKYPTSQVHCTFRQQDSSQEIFDGEPTRWYQENGSSVRQDMDSEVDQNRTAVLRSAVQNAGRPQRLYPDVCGSSQHDIRRGHQFFPTPQNRETTSLSMGQHAGFPSNDLPARLPSASIYIQH